MKLHRGTSLFFLFIFLSGCGLFSREEENSEQQKPPVQTSATEEAIKDQSSSSDDAEVVSATPITEASSDRHDWSYEGENGPQNWGDLKSEYALCKNGVEQSPVDLKYKKPKTNRAIQISYQATPARVIDDGRTVRVIFNSGNHIEIENQKFLLTHADFHTASEHTLSGNKLPMELQLFHKAENGDKVAALAVILIEGEAHPVIESIWQNMPIQKGMEKELNFEINPSEFIPSALTYYNYAGSLTTPPCTEGVDWNVFNTPMTLSKEQILTFRQLYPDNSRPIQDLGQRSTRNYK